MKGIFRGLTLMLFALVANTVMGATLSVVAFGGSPEAGAIVGNVIGLVTSGALPAGTLHAGVFAEIWTGEMIKAFRTAPEQLGWYDRIRSYDQYVNNDVIHFTELGGEMDQNGIIKFKDPIGDNKIFQDRRKELEDTDIEIELEAPTVALNEIKELSMADLEALEGFVNFK